MYARKERSSLSFFVLYSPQYTVNTAFSDCFYDHSYEASAHHLSVLHDFRSTNNRRQEYLVVLMCHILSLQLLIILLSISSISICSLRSTSITLKSSRNSYNRFLSTTMSAARDSLDEAVSTTGKFERGASGYRDTISSDHPVYKPEFQRYHLYISLACPWANRCYLALKIKGKSDMHQSW